ncbi:hypothetical protein PFLUV_G00267910 [Perca fluviatilis]|uniref:HD domain-containing protein n=1 Tax=Perca fluviatilis TaxID=8168 RepID=A0A6A5EFF7_PERFL|nr:hypothetical protein PFLUV_G00267910 [Perca fluviatilis]
MSDSSETPQKTLKMDHKVFNDPIHGTVELHPLLIKIIDTPQFQRLRNIKQLGGAYFVYPGASHNRFEHSIGYVAELYIDDRDVLCVKIAGLCHDLGHGPFSHLYDQMFIPKVQPENVWKHEDNSVKMFDHLVESNNLELEMKHKENGLTDDDLNFIKKLIEGLKDPTKVQEVGNLYDMFYTRNCLHRRACQHKVNKIIEYMIAEAFVKADEHIKIEGSQRQMFTLSTAKDDMEAYTKLTDHVFEQILHSSSTDLAEAKKILERIISRDHYSFLGETKPRQVPTREKIRGLKEDLDQARQDVCPEDHNCDPILNPCSKDTAKACKELYDAISQTLDSFRESGKPTEETYRRWEGQLAEAVPKGGDGGVTLTAQDFVVLVTTFDYGMKDKDPIKNVYFYNKINDDTAFNIPRDQVSKLLPECFSEQLIRVYSKKTDGPTVEAARKHFIKWCKDKDLPKPQ